MKVIIADADLHFVEQARDYLEAHAHLVIHNSSPSQALEHARRWQPDLVIAATDLAYAGLIEKLQTFTQRPAILLTAHMDQFATAWRAWQRGGDDLFMKPMLRPVELHQAIVSAMENAAAGTRAVHCEAVPA